MLKSPGRAFISTLPKIPRLRRASCKAFRELSKATGLASTLAAAEPGIRRQW